MVLFISAFGATWAYENPEAALKTLGLFINSLKNQGRNHKRERAKKENL